MKSLRFQLPLICAFILANYTTSFAQAVSEKKLQGGVTGSVGFNMPVMGTDLLSSSTGFSSSFGVTFTKASKESQNIALTAGLRAFAEVGHPVDAAFMHSLVGKAQPQAAEIILGSAQLFAKQAHEQGMNRYDAAVTAAKTRLRPILMTSLAFILGVVPLAISSGAGSASRHSIGTGVIGGMLAATLLATFLIPMFYLLVESAAQRVSQRGKARE